MIQTALTRLPFDLQTLLKVHGGVVVVVNLRREIMTATPSTEQTRRPEEEIIATAASTEQAPAVDAGGCD